MRQRLSGCLCAVAMVLLLGAAPAGATFPGENGRLAVSVQVRPNPEWSPVMTVQTADPDGTDFVRLTDPVTPSGAAQNAFSAEWSADGKRLAFGTYTLIPDLKLRLEVMNADGSDRRVVLVDSGSGDWFPDGERIFLGSRIVDVDTGTTTPVATFDHLPEGLSVGRWDLSPDGTQVAFDGWYDIEVCDYTEDPPECYMVPDESHIYVVNVDSSGLRELPANLFNLEGAAWSPDGTKIAYSRANDLRVIDADGQDDHSLGVRGRNPVWSPDGTQIVYEVRVGAFRPDHYVIGANGSNPTKITEGDSFSDEHSVTSWQPLVNSPPACGEVRATPAGLWPVNKKLRVVTLSGGSDPDGDPVTLEITGVTQDEPTGGTRDAVAAGAGNQVRLRAERDARGDGRIYQLAFAATDSRGGSCTGTAGVSVPRHRNAAATDSAPPGYDSFGG